MKRKTTFSDYSLCFEFDNETKTIEVYSESTSMTYAQFEELIKDYQYCKDSNREADNPKPSKSSMG